MSKYNSLLSYSIGEPAIKKGVIPKASFVNFDSRFHEFLTESLPGKYAKYAGVNDFSKLKDLAHLVQFVTKYWDISKYPTVNLLWVRDKKVEVPEIFKTFFPLVTLSIIDSKDPIEGSVDNLFLFWDTHEKLEDKLFERLSPKFLQIVVNGKILRNYGEIFWDGRLYFNIGDENVRLVTNRFNRKIKYSADIFESKNLRPQGNFYNIFNGSVKYFSLAVLGFKNDWESSLLAHIFKEFLEKTAVDADIAIAEDDVYHTLRIKSGKTKVKKSVS